MRVMNQQNSSINFKWIALMLMLHGVCNFIHAQNDTTSISNVIWSKIESLTPTIVTLPNGYNSKKSHTLIIGLHGFGSTAKSYQNISKPFTDAGFIFATPEAPYSYLRQDGTIGYEWFLYDISTYIMLERPATDLEISAMRVTTEKHMDQVITDLKSQYNIGEIYFAGMSQGGIITYLAGIHHHDKIDGMIIFASVVDEDWLGNDDIKDGNGVRTLIIQGKKDRAVPYKFAEAARDLLIKNGYNVTYKTFDGGHIVPKHLLPFVIDWINKK
ncbi:alpha/beta hydrolase [Aestuariibaculum sediminum]|uniref:Alpha/beta hydrolase n=1 Tax=Aestuariibaculum sediminum TaxID=2770637 RepID=A0A8J6PZI4_9FLAO|nr:alpha/beta hydrolase [Aestuariibaculum sediminum]MBD0831592.1 alpha/beta hydrolase [Aestuariibaculum sediminum]